MIFNDFSDNDLIVLNNAINGFLHEIKGIDIPLAFTHDPETLISLPEHNQIQIKSLNINLWTFLSCDQQFLENIFYHIQEILKNREFFKEWWSYDLTQAFNLQYKEINVLILMLEQIFDIFKIKYQSDEDYEVFYFELIMNSSFDDLKQIYDKLNVFCLEQKFNEISDRDLQILLDCNNDLLNKIMPKIIVTLNNRLFCKEWGNFDPQLPFCFDEQETKIVFSGLEQILFQLSDIEFAAKSSFSITEIVAIKMKFEVWEASFKSIIK